MNGAATNPDCHVVAYAAAQVKKGLEVAKKLGAENFGKTNLKNYPGPASVFPPCCVCVPQCFGVEGKVSTPFATPTSLLNWSIWLTSSKWLSVSAYLSMKMNRSSVWTCLILNLFWSEYKEKIGLKCQFLIEPKPKEPCKHQYDYGMVSQMSPKQKLLSLTLLMMSLFYRRYECNWVPEALWLGEWFQVEHRAQPHHPGRTLVRARHRHGLRVSCLHCYPKFVSIAATCVATFFFLLDRFGMLGSVDSNTGSPDLGWDTDQFPMDIRNTTLVMKVGSFCFDFTFNMVVLKNKIGY